MPLVVNLELKRYYMISYFGKTDIGLHRQTNQDSYLAIQNKYGDFLGLVCDGIGGARAGDVASGETVKYFEKSFKKSGPFTSLDDVRNYISYHLKKANQRIYDLSVSHKEFDGMGTTLTGIIITNFGILSINIGDSRVYGFLDRKSFRLTNDHTLVNKMLQNGEITYEESINHPQKHYLVRAIGVWNEVECDIHEVKDMDYFVLCSDGLCGYVDDDEINGVVYHSNETTCEGKCQDLINLALLKGGYDNVTVVVVKR